MRYLPPFEAIKSKLNLTSARWKTRVQMSYDDLQTMIRTLLTVVEVDTAFYLRRNPDVADGIKLGTIQSARQHFVDHGYFEGRLPYRIDVQEDWYLRTNPDVAGTVQSGVYASGQDHFDGPGYPEGRKPFPVVG